MVKGVHKKIIEINHPGGDYFEKAVFYLRPGVSQLPPELAEAAARMMLEELEPQRGRTFRKRKIAVIAGCIAAAAIIAICAVMLR
ncbi:MAG: hypothetical protein IJY74_00650 [Oscillospiraceae bacterium]|nr:hypothetical protein [Oscillospiraceae bacterium]